MYEEFEYFEKKEQKRLQEWKNIVAAMDEFPIHSKYELDGETNKFVRFTEYLKKMIPDLLSGSDYRVPPIEGMCNRGLLVLTFAGNKFPNDWWDTALKVGKGQRVSKPLPSIKNFGTELFSEVTDKEKIDNIYVTFMPMYRALKESFDKRPFWHWITRHNEYTAERDSLTALSGLMMSLTGEKQEDINQAYNEYKKVMPNTSIAYTEAKEDVSKQSEAAMDKAPTPKTPESGETKNKAISKATEETKRNEAATKTNAEAQKDEAVSELPKNEVESDLPKNESAPEVNNAEKVNIQVILDNDSKDIEIEMAIQERNELDKSIDSISSL